MWPLPKSSEDSSKSAASVKDGWGWYQARLGHGGTSPAPGWLSVVPPQSTVPRQGPRCLGGMGKGTVAPLPWPQARGGCQCSMRGSEHGTGRRDPIRLLAGMAWPGAWGGPVPSCVTSLSGPTASSGVREPRDLG